MQVIRLVNGVSGSQTALLLRLLSDGKMQKRRLNEPPFLYDKNE